MDQGQGRLMLIEPVEIIDVAVVGAGFAGMLAAYNMRKAGHSIQGFEKGSDVGGTWFWNRYPGLRCDVESVEYSYSWDEELQQDWTWTERYSAQPEILKYAQHVADRFNLRELFAFNTKVVSAVFDDVHNLWTITTDTGEIHTAR